MITPVSRSVTIWVFEVPAMRSTKKTAAMAKTKAANWVGKLLPKKTSETAAPKAAPKEIPRMYSLTRGFLKSAWREAPETDSAAPTIRASKSRGSLILKTMSLRAWGISW